MLFVPGDREDMIEKAMRFEADSVILDLEDAVLPERKMVAREAIAQALQALDFRGKERVVRINSLQAEAAHEDLQALSKFKAKPDAVIVPKAESAEQIKEVERRLGSAWLIPAIETARGVLEADERDALLCAKSLSDRSGRLWASSHRLPLLKFKDLEGLKEDARHAASLGFAGKAVIHPNQIPIVNEIFTPSAERVTWARKIIEAYERAGRGAIAVEGEVVDLMTVRMAERILKAAERLKE